MAEVLYLAMIPLCLARVPGEGDKPQQSRNDFVEEIALEHKDIIKAKPDNIAELNCWLEDAMPEIMEVSIRQVRAETLHTWTLENDLPMVKLIALRYFICKILHKRNTLQRVDESTPAIYKEPTEWLSEAGGQVRPSTYGQRGGPY